MVAGRNWLSRMSDSSKCTKMAIAWRVRCHATKSVQSNLFMLLIRSGVTVALTFQFVCSENLVHEDRLRPN